MAWVAVDADGSEFIYDEQPVRYGRWWNAGLTAGSNIVKLPIGTIEKLLGRVLTWEDEPVEI